MAPRLAKQELQKALAFVQAHLNETRHLLVLPDETTPLRNPETIKQLRALLQIDPTSLDVDAAWELSAALKRINLLLGDAEYISSQLEYELYRADASSRGHRWDDHFDRDNLTQLASAFRQRKVSADSFREAVDRLTFLYLRREEAGRERRARAAHEWRRARVVATTTAFAAIVLCVSIVISLSGLHDLWGMLGSGVFIGVAVSPVLVVPWAFEFRDRLVTLDELGSFARTSLLIAALVIPVMVAVAAAFTAVHAAGVRLEEKDASTSGLVVAACASVLALGVVIATGFWRRWIFWRASRDESVVRAAIANLVALVVLTELFAVVTMAVISRGGIAVADPARVRLGIVEQYYVWNLADALPVLELPKTLNWDQPLTLGDHQAGQLLLAYKLLVILPIAGFIAYLINMPKRDAQAPASDEGRETEDQDHAGARRTEADGLYVRGPPRAQARTVAGSSISSPSAPQRRRLLPVGHFRSPVVAVLVPAVKRKRMSSSRPPKASVLGTRGDFSCKPKVLGVPQWRPQ